MPHAVLEGSGSEWAGGPTCVVPTEVVLAELVVLVFQAWPRLPSARDVPPPSMGENRVGRMSSAPAVALAPLA